MKQGTGNNYAALEVLESPFVNVGHSVSDRPQPEATPGGVLDADTVVRPRSVNGTVYWQLA